MSKNVFLIGLNIQETEKLLDYIKYNLRQNAKAEGDFIVTGLPLSLLPTSIVTVENGKSKEISLFEFISEVLVNADNCKGEAAEKV